MTLYPTSNNELVKNEIIIGAGITLLGGAIGFGYGYWKSTQAKQSGSAATQTDLTAAFEGALIGIIIALFAVILYRAFFHSQAIYHTAKQQQIAGYAQRAQALGQLSTTAAGVNPQGLAVAKQLGLS